jgi:hypothetical protein
MHCGSRIIRPLRWVDSRPSPDDLRRDVEEQLVHLGARLGVPAAPAKNARDFLVAALLDSLRQAPAKRLRDESGPADNLMLLELVATPKIGGCSHSRFPP